MSRPKVILEKGSHRGNNVIFFSFQWDQTLIDAMRQIPEAMWSQTNKKWYVVEKDFDLETAFEAFKDIAWLDYSIFKQNDIPVEPDRKPFRESKTQRILTPEHRELIEKFRTWLLHKRYSPSSIRVYTEMLEFFAFNIQPKSLHEVTNECIVNFVHDHLVLAGYSHTIQNQLVSALKLFYREVIHAPLVIDSIERPKREHKLPNVLSKDEVMAILRSIRNVKHKCMLSLIYACGLRRSELLNIKHTDVDTIRHLLLIRNAKGRKDRVVPISEKTVSMIQEYRKMYITHTWLFEGQMKGEQYSAQSLSKVLKEAVEQAGIRKPVSLHWLRHSYATHLLESGTDLRYIQELLGHKSSRTTEIYTHVTQQSLEKIKSPFDDMKI